MMAEISSSSGKDAFDEHLRKLQEARREREVEAVRCRIYFWQQRSEDDIEIGHVPIQDDSLLIKMKGAGNQRACMLAVIDGSNTERLNSITTGFKRYKVEDQSHAETQKFRPTASLIGFIKGVAQEWEPTVS